MNTRLARHQDCTQIATIYNLGIREGKATFEVRDRAEDEVLGWLTQPFPTVVVESENEVIAFARASEYRPRSCYRGIAEFGVYVHPAHRGQGAGRAAMLALEDELSRLEFWKMVSRIFVDNEPSRRLMLSLGFREVGTYEKHAQLDGIWRDVLIVEKWFGHALDG